MEKATLIHGDCLEILPSIENDSVNLLFTDLPYGHNNNDGKDLISVRERVSKKWRHKFWKEERDGTHGAPRPISNDGREADLLYRRILKRTRRILTYDGVACFCCSGGGPDTHSARWTLWMEKYLHFKQMVVWDKGKMGMGWHYRRSYEVILVGQKSKSKCAWYDKTNQIENVIRPGNYGIRKIIPSADDHPTEKPWQLAAHFIKLHTKPGDTVLDVCMGSGSTVEAAVRMGRKAIGIELDPEHFAKAEKRIRKLEKELSYSIFAHPPAEEKKKSGISHGFFDDKSR